jgi:hypothetical protein
MEHQVYMPRLVTELMNALDELGVENPTDHFAIYNLPMMRRKLMLLSKQPLTDEIRKFAYGELTEEKFNAIHLLYPPANDSLKANLINKIVVNGWKNECDSAPIDISPVTDNRPFVAQLGLWRNLTKERMERVIPYAEFYGFPLSKMVIFIILAVVIVLILPVNLLPYFTKGEKLKIAPWLYFFLIGMAYMAVEVVLIQKYGLLIGPSAYSVAVVLLTLLAASGLGSLASKKFSTGAAFIGIILWLILDAFVFRHLIYALGDMTVVPRLIAAVVMIFPLGFFMGMPFPKGTLRVRELIDWGFAVNGAGSVLGATLVLLAAFSYGFTIALTIAAGIYLAAFLLILAKKAW